MFLIWFFKSYIGKERIIIKYNERGLLMNNFNEYWGWLDNNKEGVDIWGFDEFVWKSMEVYGYIWNKMKLFEVRWKWFDLEGNVWNWM